MYYVRLMLWHGLTNEGVFQSATSFDVLVLLGILPLLFGGVFSFVFFAL